LVITGWKVRLASRLGITSICATCNVEQSRLEDQRSLVLQKWICRCESTHWHTALHVS
jgi:hypothetical protein